ncbi:MAG TPA: DegT/DnrJ/EryC1/StrS family aminotransferase [Candidatus Acidoferrum sp.]|nr:DegT/DnrJ/EryC1/StrS family aminotransferase [Candidatus Acidoferrum sp.]
MSASTCSPEGAGSTVARAAEAYRTPAQAVAGFDFLDLKAQFAPIREEIMEAVTRVMDSQHFILGTEVRLLEEEIAAMLGAKHAIACASGSDALVLAMAASEIQAGDEVITTPFTFFATGGSIARAGARPVFVDINPDTFNIDANGIESALTSKTRAILPVHLFGLPVELQPILKLATAKGLIVIEDAAQAIGARYCGRSVGTIGTLGCFSFFPSKNLGGAGDGGLITTEDGALTDRLQLLRVHGSRKKYHHEILGTNSRLDALQAAILRVKLRHLNDWTSERQLRAERYRELFTRMRLQPFVRFPQSPESDVRHVYNQFSIRCERRDELREFLRQSGIPTEIYYPVPLHLQEAFAYLGYRVGQFPNAERVSREVLALPVYPELKQQQQEAVVRSIANFYLN